jgi:hypothetical protein
MEGRVGGLIEGRSACRAQPALHGWGLTLEPSKFLKPVGSGFAL